MRAAWQQRQDSQDRVSRRFSESIRGVESYENPYESRAVELPGGYKGAWVSSSGEYVLAEDASYDPNVGSTIAWKRMEPRH